MDPTTRCDTEYMDAMLHLVDKLECWAVGGRAAIGITVLTRDRGDTVDSGVTLTQQR